MPDYRRAWHPGGTYFFTANLLKRQGSDLLTRHVDLLRQIVGAVRERHPFRIHGWVVLPDHLHCVVELPEGDADFATRWRLIRMGFSKRFTDWLAKAFTRWVGRVGRKWGTGYDD